MSSDLPRLFAEIAPRFGLSRPAGLCLGAIWRAAEAPSADDLVASLGISRSNVSTALKELRSWGLIEVTRAFGARRDLFLAPADPWALLRQILAERQRREIAPVIDRLQTLAASGEDPRAGDLLAAFEAASDWMAALARQEPGDLAQLMGATGSEIAFVSPEGGKKKKKKNRDKG